MTPLSKVCGDIAYYVGEGMFQKGDRERLERVVKEAGKIIGVSRQDLRSVYTDKKLHHVVDDVSHLLHDRLSGQLIARSGRMSPPSAATSRYRSTPLNASAFGVTLDSSVKSRPAQQTKSTSPGRLQFGVIICYHKIKR